jgi:hypothetical protein
MQDEGKDEGARSIINQSRSNETGSPNQSGLKTVTALLQTIVDGVVAVLFVEQGDDKIGGNLLDEIHTAFFKGDLVCCMTQWNFFEIMNCQKDSCVQRCWRKTLTTSISN